MDYKSEDFEKIWDLNYGLVTPRHVAKMLGLKGGPASITPIWKKKKLEIITFDNIKCKPLLAWKDYKHVKEEREKNGKIKHPEEAPPSLSGEKDKSLS